MEMKAVAQAAASLLGAAPAAALVVLPGAFGTLLNLPVQASGLVLGRQSASVTGLQQLCPEPGSRSWHATGSVMPQPVFDGCSPPLEPGGRALLCKGSVAASTGAKQSLVATGLCSIKRSMFATPHRLPLHGCGAAAQKLNCSCPRCVHSAVLRRCLASQTPTSIPHEKGKQLGGEERAVPPINPREPYDKETREVVEARSSEVSSVRPAVDKDTLELVEEVMMLYESDDTNEQQRVLDSWYSKDAVYEDNVLTLQGRQEIARGLAAVHRLVDSVEVCYETPVVLGGTGGLDVLDNYTHKPNIQLEVNNTQTYHLKGGESLPAHLMNMPQEIVLKGVTRLQLDPETRQVVHHEDNWVNVSNHTEAFRRMVALLVNVMGAGHSGGRKEQA